MFNNGTVRRTSIAIAMLLLLATHAVFFLFVCLRVEPKIKYDGSDFVPIAESCSAAAGGKKK